MFYWSCCSDCSGLFVWMLGCVGLECWFGRMWWWCCVNFLLFVCLWVWICFVMWVFVGWLLMICDGIWCLGLGWLGFWVVWRDLMLRFLLLCCWFLRWFVDCCLWKCCLGCLVWWLGLRSCRCCLWVCFWGLWCWFGCDMLYWWCFVSGCNWLISFMCWICLCWMNFWCLCLLFRMLILCLFLWCCLGRLGWLLLVCWMGYRGCLLVWCVVVVKWIWLKGCRCLLCLRLRLVFVIGWFYCGLFRSLYRFVCCCWFWRWCVFLCLGVLWMEWVMLMWLGCMCNWLCLFCCLVGMVKVVFWSCLLMISMIVGLVWVVLLVCWDIVWSFVLMLCCDCWVLSLNCGNSWWLWWCWSDLNLGCWSWLVYWSCFVCCLDVVFCWVGCWFVGFESFFL